MDKDKGDFNEQIFAQKIQCAIYAALLNQRKAVQKLTKEAQAASLETISITGLQRPDLALASAARNTQLAILAQPIRSKGRNTSEEEWELLIDEALQDFMQTGEPHSLKIQIATIANQFKREVLEVIKMDKKLMSKS